MNIGDVLMVVKLEDAVSMFSAYKIDEIQKDDMGKLLLGMDGALEEYSFPSIALTMKKTNKRNKEQIRVEEINNSIPVVDYDTAKNLVHSFYKQVQEDTNYIWCCLIRDYELDCIDHAFLARPIDIKLESPMVW